MEGWIKLHRKIIDTPLWLSEPFSRSQAWIDLLILANSNDGFFFKRGIRVDVKRGQIGHDLDTLAKKWKWSRGKVNRFISMLEMDKQIVRQKTNVTTLLTIINYETYQSSDKANSKANDKPNGHQTVEQTDTNKNKENEKNEKKEELLSKIQKEFYDHLTKFTSEFGKTVLREFYNYWSEPNKSRTKIRWQLEKTWDTKKRLERWVNNIGKQTKQTNQQTWNEKIPQEI